MSKNAGRIISIDGISGTGKSQIMRHLMGYYDKYNAYKVAGFSENLISPERVGLAKKIDAIRSDLSLSDSKKNTQEDKIFTEIAANDRAYISRTFIPFIQQVGFDILFLDRWYPTNMAYQSLNQLTMEEILEIHQEKMVTEPNIYIILTCSIEIAVDRVDKRITKKIRGVSGKMSTVRTKSGKVDLAASFRKKEKIQNQFLKLPELIGKNKCLIIDTNRNIYQILVEILSELSNFGIHAGRAPYIAEKFDELGIPEYDYDHQVISG